MHRWWYFRSTAHYLRHTHGIPMACKNRREEEEKEEEEEEEEEEEQEEEKEEEQEEEERIVLWPRKKLISTEDEKSVEIRRLRRLSSPLKKKICIGEVTLLRGEEGGQWTGNTTKRTLEKLINFPTFLLVFVTLDSFFISGWGDKTWFVVVASAKKNREGPAWIYGKDDFSPPPPPLPPKKTFLSVCTPLSLYYKRLIDSFLQTRLAKKKSDRSPVGREKFCANDICRWVLVFSFFKKKKTLFFFLSGFFWSVLDVFLVLPLPPPLNPIEGDEGLVAVVVSPSHKDYVGSCHPSHCFIFSCNAPFPPPPLSHIPKQMALQKKKKKGSSSTEGQFVSLSLSFSLLAPWNTINLPPVFPNRFSKSFLLPLSGGGKESISPDRDG